MSPAPPPQAEMKEKIKQNKMKTEELQMTLESFGNPLPIKKYFFNKDLLKKKTPHTQK